MDESEVMQTVDRAVEALIENDNVLLQWDVNERSITHKLAEHLQTRVQNGWIVDVEYNREGHDESKKFLSDEYFSEEPSRDNDKRLVYPDIIVHKRGTNKNLVVIEVKKDTGLDEKDSEKVEGYIQSLGYRYGLCISFTTDGEITEDSFQCWWYPFSDEQTALE